VAVAPLAALDASQTRRAAATADSVLQQLLQSRILVEDLLRGALRTGGGRRGALPAACLARVRAFFHTDLQQPLCALALRGLLCAPPGQTQWLQVALTILALVCQSTVAVDALQVCTQTHSGAAQPCRHPV
jgi:hypothetical protein